MGSGPAAREMKGQALGPTRNTSLCTCIVGDQRVRTKRKKEKRKPHLATPLGCGGQGPPSIWMVCAKDSLLSLSTVLHQTQSICVSTSTFPSKRKVVHAGQRVGVIRPELRLASLHHLHLQLLSLLPPALVPVRRRQVGHAGQRRGMIGPELRLARHARRVTRTQARVPHSCPSPCGYQSVDWQLQTAKSG